MKRSKRKVGLWLNGIGGGIGSTVALGLAALRKGLTSTTGLVTELPVFSGLGLVDPGELMLGGHEVRAESLVDAVKGIHRRANLFDADLIRACAPALRSVQRNIRPGTLYGARDTVRRFADVPEALGDKSPAQAVQRLSADLIDFKRRGRLDHVVVVHVASSEPSVRKSAVHGDFSALSREIKRRGSTALSTSAIYALAAVEARCTFLNFTPSTGIGIPAIQHRAHELGVAYMGRDGKTGETLVKSVLAPMFATRNLSVLAWSGHNILGNRDGEVLNDPRTRASKIKTKDKIVSAIVGGNPQTKVSIDYVPSLDDWKVAWDFIHFEGFLGTRMNMQFVWHGSDSALAAPLIIDLARLAHLEATYQHVGPMPHLASFFKAPMGVDAPDHFSQWARLMDYVAHRRRTADGRAAGLGLAP